jgi:hypothetical protein
MCALFCRRRLIDVVFIFVVGLVIAIVFQGIFLKGSANALGGDDNEEGRRSELQGELKYHFEIREIGINS